MVPRNRDWSSLARSSRRRWVAAYGGRGTPERRAERARRAYEAGEHLTPAQRGHEPSAVRDDRTISAFVGSGAAFVELSGLTRAEVRRLARYDSLVGQLARGQIGGREFRRRVGSWRPVQGLPLASDPEAVLAAVERRRAADVEVFTYRSGRAA